MLINPRNFGKHKLVVADWPLSRPESNARGPISVAAATSDEDLDGALRRFEAGVRECMRGHDNAR